MLRYPVPHDGEGDGSTMKTASGVVTPAKFGILQGPSQKTNSHPLVAVTQFGGAPTANRRARPFHGQVAMLQALQHAATVRVGKRRGKRS